MNPSATARAPSAGGTPTPKVSVVVSTWNRAGLLPRLFRALDAQDLASTEFEFVVVDNASRDETPSVLARCASAARFPVRIVNMSVNRGPGRARNRGAEMARAAVIAFTDDDCVPTPSWLSSGLRHAGWNRIVVGRTMPDPDAVQGPFSRTLRVSNTRYMQTCNIFYDRRELIEGGGFDPKFERGGEDTDLGLRLQKHGATAVFCPEALVYHDVSRSDVGAAVRDALRKWTDLPLVVRHHPEVRAWLPGRIFWKRSHPPVLLAMLGVLGAVFNAWLIVGIGPWLHFRLLRAPLAPRIGGRLRALPGALLVDCAEVASMLRGSIRHRALLL